MSKLMVAPGPRDEHGQILSVTPQSAGWEYVGFEVYSLRPGEVLERDTNDREVCLVLLSGKAKIQTAKQSFGTLGHRMSVFERIPPFSVYVPNDDRYSVQAETALELAVCSGPGKGTYPARVIAPEDVGVETRGSGSMERHIHNILPEQPARRGGLYASRALVERSAAQARPGRFAAGVVLGGDLLPRGKPRTGLRHAAGLQRRSHAR